METFKSLALLVPLLGSKTVVGGKAEKIFYDRKPDVSFMCKDFWLKQSFLYEDYDKSKMLKHKVFKSSCTIR